MLMRIVPAIVIAALTFRSAPDPASEKFWPQWRGPYATGVSKSANPPVEWSESKNIKWKVEIPGRGSASPVVWGDRVFVLTAMPAGATGDPSHQALGGVRPRAAHRFVVPYVPSPLLYDSILYILKTNSGILSAFDAKTGKPHYQLQRLEGVPNVFASPVGAQGRVYIPGRDGTTLVIKHGPAYEVLAKNTLDDGFDASPALVDEAIYLRGYKYLYAIAAK